MEEGSGEGAEEAKAGGGGGAEEDTGRGIEEGGGVDVDGDRS